MKPVAQSADNGVGGSVANASLNTTALERVLKRDRAIVVAALTSVTALSWLYIIQMTHIPARGMRHVGGIILSCCGVDFWVTFLMWTVMMVGMMVPSAAPMILAFAMMNRRRAERGGPYVPTASFVAGYLVAWTVFSAVAALAQWALFQAALLNPRTETVGPALAGALLIVAGIFQLSSAKYACLTQCRSPLAFLLHEWRDGSRGALRMGLRHGAFCIGCCWMLMALLFVAGVMNLLWVAAIAAYVLAEKVLPAARAVSRIGAAACLAVGAVLVVRAVIVG